MLHILINFPVKCDCYLFLIALVHLDSRWSNSIFEKNTIHNYDLLKCNVKIFALHEDIEAHGFKKIIATKFKIIDYSSFVKSNNETFKSNYLVINS